MYMVVLEIFTRNRQCQLPLERTNELKARRATLEFSCVWTASSFYASKIYYLACAFFTLSGSTLASLFCYNLGSVT